MFLNAEELLYRECSRIFLSLSRSLYFSLSLLSPALPYSLVGLPFSPLAVRRPQFLLAFVPWEDVANAAADGEDDSICTSDNKLEEGTNAQGGSG